METSQTELHTWKSDTVIYFKCVISIMHFISGKILFEKCKYLGLIYLAQFNCS